MHEYSPEKTRYHLRARYSSSLKFPQNRNTLGEISANVEKKTIPLTLQPKCVLNVRMICIYNKVPTHIRDDTAGRRAAVHCDHFSSRARSSARLDFADSPALCAVLRRGSRQYDHVRCARRAERRVSLRANHCSFLMRITII